MSASARSAPLRSREDREEDPGPALARTWAEVRGVRGFFTEVNTFVIGRRILVTAFAFFAAGGVEALVMRLQLARPDHSLVGPDLYDQLFSMHGTTMMFLFAVPVLQGLGTYLVPLMVGARSLAFPRLNAFAYHTYLLGGLLLYAAFFLNTGPDAGWFAYTPLSGPSYSPGKRIDVWAQVVTFTELSALATAVNLIVTTFKHRAPGMSLTRIPLFVWATLVTSFMVVFAMPAVMVASTGLAMDRLIGTHFFNPVEGGDPLLYQHLFWFFGHPEVYIIFLPALGIVSSIVVSSARRAVVGYPAMVLSLVATGFMAFGLWVHHMFATGLPQIGESFFTAASIMIAVPTGVQIFCWIATLWTGRLELRTPLLFVLGFFFVFVLGGLTGVMLASVPVDLQVHDTFFVVAHLHYVLIGGAVLPLFGAVYHWFPKLTGRLLDERLGRVHFWLFFTGFNVAFFPMHVLGLHGMTRRISTYAAATGFGPLNVVATGGTVLLAAGVAVFLFNVARALRRPPDAPPDPWKADTLEWASASPPPPFAFERLPVVEGRYPMWERGEAVAEVTGLDPTKREVLVTDALDARPDHRTVLPHPTPWPFCGAMASGVVFVGLIFTPWAAPAGAALLALSLVGWFWSRPAEKELLAEQP